MIGVRPQAVSKMVAAGKLPTQNGKVVMPDALMAYQHRKDNRYSASDETLKKADSGKIYQQAKAATQTYTAQIKKLELEKMKGDLIPITEAMAEFEMVATVIRSQLVSLPSRIAGLLEDKTASQIEILLNKEINEILSALNNTRFSAEEIAEAEIEELTNSN
jgi:polyhydroxyalkanoate synthesis regulator phasin